MRYLILASLLLGCSSEASQNPTPPETNTPPPAPSNTTGTPGLVLAPSPAVTVSPVDDPADDAGINSGHVSKFHP